MIDGGGAVSFPELGILHQALRVAVWMAIPQQGGLPWGLLALSEGLAKCSLSSGLHLHGYCQWQSQGTVSFCKCLK